jgi:glycosyltransferase involved in cell wall biosynthesis
MKISVIIPVRNEEDSIRVLLDSLLTQTLPPAEIVITDGGSTDNTPAIISEYIEGGAQIRLLREAAALPGRGRNLGAGRAANEWLAFIDAGTSPEPAWLESLAEQLQASNEVDVVYGSFQPVTDTFFKECAAIAFVPPPVIVNGEPMRTRSIASALMRKSVWQGVGGFPEDLRSAEDLLFIDKVDAAGFEIAYAPRAMVHWSIQPTLGKTFKRFVAYSHHNIRAGLWNHWQSRIFRRYGLLLLLALPIFFLGRAWLRWSLALPIGAWLLMLLARSIIAIWRNRHCYPAGIGRNLMRVVALTALVATIDSAAIVGSLQWLLTDRTYANATRGSDHVA